MSTEVTISAEQRLVFGGYADQLMPSTGGMPSPTELDVHGVGLDRLIRLRPELEAPVLAAVETGVTDIFVLRETAPDLFQAVSAAAAGIYLTEPVIQRNLGYPGRPPLDVGDVDAREAEQWAMTEGVRERGNIWKTTPPEAIGGST